MEDPLAAKLAFHPFEGLHSLFLQLLAGTAAVNQCVGGTEAQPDAYSNADGLAQRTVMGDHFSHTNHVTITPEDSL